MLFMLRNILFPSKTVGELTYFSVITCCQAAKGLDYHPHASLHSSLVGNMADDCLDKEI